MDMGVLSIIGLGEGRGVSRCFCFRRSASFSCSHCSAIFPQSMAAWLLDLDVDREVGVRAASRAAQTSPFPDYCQAPRRVSYSSLEQGKIIDGHSSQSASPGSHMGHRQSLKVLSTGLEPWVFIHGSFFPMTPTLYPGCPPSLFLALPNTYFGCCRCRELEEG